MTKNKSDRFKVFRQSRSRREHRPFLRLALFVIAVIYLGALITALFLPDSIIVVALRLSAVVFALIFACVRAPKDNPLKLALVFTLLADTLLITDNFLVLGVIVFCIAQLFHLFRLTDQNLYVTIVYLFFVSLAGLCFVLDFEPIFLVAGIYGATLLSNLSLAGRWFKSQKSTNSRSALIGFLLFLLCDLCVGAAYLSASAVFPVVLEPIMNYLAWAFYFPSQILLANSSKL